MFNRNDRSAVATGTQGGSHETALQQQGAIGTGIGHLECIPTRMTEHIAPAGETEAFIWDVSGREACGEWPWPLDEDDRDICPEPAQTLSESDAERLRTT